MGRGYNTYGTGNQFQMWDTGFSGGIPNFESWCPSWILRKNINFQTLLKTLSLVFFISFRQIQPKRRQFILKF
jgi:hypothetical protein